MIDGILNIFNTILVVQYIVLQLVKSSLIRVLEFNLRWLVRVLVILNFATSREIRI